MRFIKSQEDIALDMTTYQTNVEVVQSIEINYLFENFIVETTIINIF